MLRNAQSLLPFLNVASGIQQMTHLDFKAIIFALAFDSFSEKQSSKRI